MANSWPETISRDKYIWHIALDEAGLNIDLFSLRRVALEAEKNNLGQSQQKVRSCV